MHIYHVSKQGHNHNDGSEVHPFLTIQRAASIAAAGDRIIVHEGEYREWVRPENGGLHDGCRIVYEAAPGEHVVIKGSEQITGWENIEGTVWKVRVPDTLFEKDNPYKTPLGGDWFIDPKTYNVHAGEIYLNGRSLYEAESPEQVMHPVIRMESPHETWDNRPEQIWEPENTLYQWCALPEEDAVILYANFQGADPNKELVEINVRQSCFYPEKTGINYITVRGFEMCQAAAPWAPPTAVQPGLLGPNWSRGWIIENNIIHDAKCSGITLGKETSTGNNDYTKYHRKPGYQYQMEAVFKARNIGWSKERIGSHIIRNNRIYDCGQNGIVGHMGCIFSEIYGNEISRIAIKHEFYGHEIAGIKLHAAIDVQIHHNYIHHCSLGTWLDWQAQGARISSNIYDKNNRDFMIEVTHGPYLVDNNIFTSPYSFVNAAQGGAYVHNLCCGFTNQYPVLNRATPYHFPHSTEVMGTVPVYGKDDRWYQNIFVGGAESDRHYGTALYDGCPVSMKEYTEAVQALGNGDLEQFEMIPQPAYINGNVYFNGASGFAREEHHLIIPDDPEAKITEENGIVYLEITLPQTFFDCTGEIIDTQKLGMARIPEERFENPDGSDLQIDTDMTGNRRDAETTAGPLAQLQPGKNKIPVFAADK